MSNPMQQQSELNAVSTPAKVNGYDNFNKVIGKNIFNPVKYGAAISRKLEAVIEEGALEEPEFKTAALKFVGLALTLVGASSVAISAKGMNPGKDVLVLTTLEEVVVSATEFIPLIEKLYSAYEGVEHQQQGGLEADARIPNAPEVIQSESEPTTSGDSTSTADTGSTNANATSASGGVTFQRATPKFTPSTDKSAT